MIERERGFFVYIGFVNSYPHDGRRQVVHASNAQEMVQQDTSIGSQSRVDDGLSIGENDGPNVAHI